MMTYAELFLILSCSVLLFCRAGNSGSSLLKKSLPFAVCILAACLPASASLGADRVQTPPESAVLNPTMENGEKEMKKAPIDTVFAQGEPNPYGQFFTGQTYLTRLSANDDVWHSSLANVTFEPGARTNWHKHSGGQILLVLDGEGRYRERGGEMRILHKGDVVRIAPDVEHWHGAAPDAWMAHISVETNLPDNQTTWLEPVADEEYE